MTGFRPEMTESGELRMQPGSYMLLQNAGQELIKLDDSYTLPPGSTFEWFEPDNRCNQVQTMRIKFTGIIEDTNPNRPVRSLEIAESVKPITPPSAPPACGTCNR